MVRDLGEYRKCAAREPFRAQGKPVLHVEYELGTAAFCPGTAAGVPLDPQARRADGPGRAVPRALITVSGAEAARLRLPHLRR